MTGRPAGYPATVIEYHNDGTTKVHDRRVSSANHVMAQEILDGNTDLELVVVIVRFPQDNIVLKAQRPQ